MTSEDIFPYSTLPKIPVEACPLCDTPRPFTGWTRDRYGFRLPIGVCPTCHLSYLAEQLTREGYARLYNGAYRPLTQSVGPVIAPAVSQQRLGEALGAGLRRRLAQAGFSARGFLLDAGGSTGVLVPALGLEPDSLTVLDPSAGELAQCHRGIKTIQGWLEDPIPGIYDGVVCLETLDHVTQPLTVLRNLRASCPRGWLLADYCVPPHFKIDHPLLWHPDAWKHALRESHWTIVSQGSYKLSAYPHHFSLCR